MKRTLLVAVLSFLSLGGFSQETAGTNTFIGVYGGVGLATANNYDVGISGGLEFVKGVGGANRKKSSRLGIGADIFYQTFSLLYDREQYDARHGVGNAGVMIRHNTSYAFVTPKFDFGLGYYQRVHAYVTAGVGFKVGGYDSVRKWDHNSASPGIGSYDSSLDLSKNINSMQIRLGCGFKEYLYMGDHWRFTFTEDLGFLGSSLTKTGGPDDPSRTEYFPLKLSPVYISLQIGIMHTKYK